jgi:hypothetical protein
MVEQLRGQFEKFMDSSYSKKRPSPHLHKVPIRSNKVIPHELCERPSYLAKSKNYEGFPSFLLFFVPTVHALSSEIYLLPQSMWQTEFLHFKISHIPKILILITT